MRCEICGKKVQFGHRVSHSKHSTRRKWLPNVRTVTLMGDGKRKRITICTRCLRTQQKITG